MGNDITVQNAKTHRDTIDRKRRYKDIISLYMDVKGVVIGDALDVCDGDGAGNCVLDVDGGRERGDG